MRLAILVSGRGSNFAAIHEAIRRRTLDATIAVVLSNRPDAAAIAKGVEWGYATHVIDHRRFADRADHEDAVRRVIDSASADFVVLAGYMRLLSPAFIAAYPNRIVNIHPSLLPAFPGVDAQAQALAHGVKISGCTVHLVDEGLDAGPIIVQRAVEVRDDDTVESLSARILEQEHMAYVEALNILASGQCRIEGRRVLRLTANG